MRASRASFRRLFDSLISLSSSHSFDKEGFSVWRVDFKYNSELTQTFMSSNQIGGFFNRLEASRKYLFGSMGVLGATNDSVISGALILRGQEVKPVIDVAPDWESYEYKKLDLTNPEDKAYFEAALAWDLELNGKKWVDGKAVRIIPCLRSFTDLLILVHTHSSSKRTLTRVEANEDVSITSLLCLARFFPLPLVVPCMYSARKLHTKIDKQKWRIVPPHASLSMCDIHCPLLGM